MSAVRERMWFTGSSGDPTDSSTHANAEVGVSSNKMPGIASLVTENSDFSVTFRKTSADDVAMSLGVVFAKDIDAETDTYTVTEFALENTTAAGDWTTAHVDLSAWAGMWASPSRIPPTVPSGSMRWSCSPTSASSMWTQTASSSPTRSAPSP